MAFLSLKKVVPPDYHQSLELVCGIDEVGRGCWAGPLVACALLFTKKIKISGLKDSKQLSAQRREEIFELLQDSTDYGLGSVENTEIDQIGLSKATTLAFSRAISNLSIKPAYLLIDGRDRHKLAYPFKTIIKGDEKLKVIACASIIAKVTRDRLMVNIAKKYPEYGFEIHKGYGTSRHHQALISFGATKIHRFSYKPLQELSSK